MSVLLAAVMVAFGLLLLWRGADWLVSGASAIAKGFGVPSIVIGLTVVAFGTSLPELLVSVLAAVKGNSAIAFGNVLGSNIANVLLIFGVCLLIANLPMKKNTIKVEVPLAITAALMLLLFSPDGQLSTTDGIALLIGFAIFFTYTIFSAYKGKNEESQAKKIAPSLNRNQAVRAFFLIIIGLAALAWGGNLTVDGASAIAAYFGLSQALIGLTIVAVGTSLPELVTSIVGVTKGETDLVIGNIVGSNIFNTWWILGLSTIIKNIQIEGDFRLDLWLNVTTFILVMIFAFLGKPKYTLKRWQGAIFLVLYAAYVGFLVVRG
ncbi:MAG: calcium/sodium antiporter [bacterium]|nr:calcium/sodium antiporter [bacterium]